MYHIWRQLFSPLLMHPPPGQSHVHHKEEILSINSKTEKAAPKSERWGRIDPSFFQFQNILSFCFLGLSLELLVPKCSHL